MKYEIDESADWLGYCLAVCECGWRMPATSRQAAEQRLAMHEQNIHPSEETVRQMLWKRAQRTRPGTPPKTKTRRPANPKR